MRLHFGDITGFQRIIQEKLNNTLQNEANVDHVFALETFDCTQTQYTLCQHDLRRNLACANAQFSSILLRKQGVKI